MRKKNKKMIWLSFVLLAVLLVGITAFRSKRRQETHILVMSTADIHGFLMDTSSGKEETFQYRLAGIAGKVNQVRTSHRYDDVVLLDAGDMFSGHPVSDLNHGASIRAAMDRMDYDAVVLGNHEFDDDVTVYAADDKATIAPYEIGSVSGDSETPVLAANLYSADDGSRVDFTSDYTILEKAGVRIAVVGWIPDYSAAVLAEKIAPYTIDDDLAKLDALLGRINDEERPDATIVLTHADPLEIAGELSPANVDLVIGGHTHQFIAEKAANGIVCLQGYCYGCGYASAEIVIGKDGNVGVQDLRCTDLTRQRERLYDTPLNAAHLDRDIMALSRSAWAEIAGRISEELGYIDTDIVKTNDIGANSAGNWISGLMLEATKEYGTVAAFYNNSGIRTGLTIPKGKTTRTITSGDLYTMTPFSNRLLIFELTGRELAKQLADGLKHAVYGDQMSGLTFTYTADGTTDTPREQRTYTIENIVLDDGTVVDVNDETTVYRVCTSSYNAALGSSVFAGRQPVVPAEEAPVDVEAFIRVLRENRDHNGGYIPVDQSPRGIELKTEDPSEPIVTSGKEIQKHGNLGLAITASQLFARGYEYGDVLTAFINGKKYTVPLCASSLNVDTGNPLLRVVQKENQVSLAYNARYFAGLAGVAERTKDENQWHWLVEQPVPVTLLLTDKGGYKEEFLDRQMKFSNERSDYPGLTDEQFANFRMIASSGIRKGILYRSSSPVDPVNRRNTYADHALAEAGVRTIINLTDTEAKMRKYEGYEESRYSHCDIIALHLGVDFTTKEFQRGLVEGLRFMAEHEGPYLVHCTHGKDRAGVVSALLECLMGASADEVFADYMETYYNFYGITRESERYESILERNIARTLADMFQAEDIEKADLAACAGD